MNTSLLEVPTQNNMSSKNALVLKKSNGEAFTTSAMVAEKFHKLHKTVLRKVERLPKDEFWRRNFVPRDYTDGRGKQQPMYEITRDGFSYIAMSFTGEEAHKWKVAFIDAFNKMERHLRNIMQQGWLEDRAEAALEFRMMSRTLEEVRKLEGKDTKFFHYANEAKLVNWALTGRFQKVDRSTLSQSELCVLVTLEAYNAVLLGAGHDRESRKSLLKKRCDAALMNLLEAA